MTLAPAPAALLADAILATHVGIVVFVVVGEALFLAGGVRGWRWVRHFGLRVTHLVTMAVIALQAWLGALCPLTVWERSLRRQAGQAAYRESFIEHWLSRALYFELPWWVFVAAYTGFAGLVVLTWRWVPPRRVRAGARR
ncbi:DUF2784 domain-containing protein [Lysobacter sp. A3-1-A15]|uniref:DUF2784 domain-containing protein n=1 Tax=Novilysobacter viscosus TaxID=3098602 RepID=UPI002ED9B12B